MNATSEYRNYSGSGDGKYRPITVSEEYPGITVCELELTTRWNDSRPAKELIDGDLLCSPDGLHRYMAGTVIGYAISSGDDPIKALDQARGHGHDLAWLNQMATVISSRGEAPKRHIVIRDGDLIRLQGRAYRVKATYYNNLSITEERVES